MIFDEEMIEKLRISVKAELSDQRFTHTLGVEKMAAYLGRLILPDKVYELRIAALLHDIAKEIPYEEQVELLRLSDVAYTDEDLNTKPAVHSFAAVPVIKKRYTNYATPEILSAVANHTLGCEQMSIFDEIIFISDYAEDGRTYHSCKKVREYLYENVNQNNSYDQNVCVLHNASLCAVEATIQSLRQRNEKINTRTFSTKRYLEEFIH